MTKPPSFKLNYKGVGEILKSPQVAMVMNEVAARVAAQSGDDAEVKSYTTDRQAASVSVPADQQARDGLLTRAAAACGLQVRVK